MTFERLEQRLSVTLAGNDSNYSDIFEQLVSTQIGKTKQKLFVDPRARSLGSSEFADLTGRLTRSVIRSAVPIRHCSSKNFFEGLYSCECLVRRSMTNWSAFEDWKSLRSTMLFTEKFSGTNN